MGNSAVVRMVQRSRHQHGDGCGHPRDEAPAVQRSAVHDVLRRPGTPLEEPVRQEMEGRLGADFGEVRLHTDSAARASATEIGARAYTSGSHIVIGPGGADKHTLAHELTHVIQQRNGPVAGTDTGGGLRISDPSDAYEKAAEANATRVMRSTAPTVRDGHAADTATAAGSARTGQIQRYTAQDDPALGRVHVTETGQFVVVPEDQVVWVRDDVPAGQLAAALRSTNQQQVIGGGTYNGYWLGGPILLDCLHAAEEIINNQVGRLEWGGGEYSTIDTRFRGEDRAEAFGQADATNRRQARGFTGERNEAASPQPGQAFVIVAAKPDSTKEMSQFHAAAVVARDGQDCVVLEVWSDNGNPPAQGAAMAAVYTVDHMSESFHTAYGGEGAYFGQVGPITVVVRARG
ncbi:DUF4157 domain-containing protein [Streptomyces sp. ITFR-16]|uniref:DUF4157 domain-containing protein n=1 Tax=Streptomyces sp. ITFR-16 TaxID=3075198 RepID=UPI0037D998AD